MHEKIFSNGNIVLTEEQLQEKQDKLKLVFDQFFDVLGMDTTNDHNIKESSERMSKMWVRELLEGCYTAEPKITTFPNEKNMDQMIISGPIKLDSQCSHHGVIISGQAWVSYIPGDKVIGISKFSRIVRFFSRRMQIQEEMTQQISDYIQKLMEPKGVIVFVKARHYCEIARGVREENIFMTTSSVNGIFKENPATRQEFFNLINIK